MFTVWLLLQKKDSKFISMIIKKLSQKYNSPEFLPHITIYGSVDSRQAIEEAVKISIEDLKPFKVRTIGIDYSNDVWKTIFINIELNHELNLINKKISRNLNPYSAYQFVPHISLIYKKIPVIEKRKIIDNIKIKKKFTIDKIAIQKYSDNVNEWKIVKEFSF